MAPKRKSMASEEDASSSKRQKINSESTNYPCQLCTSSEADNVITARVTTKNKPTQGLTAHRRCMDIHPELECDVNKWKVLPANLSSYKARFKLKCGVCPKMHGAKIQCTVDKCTQSFHIDCATLSSEVLFDTETYTYGIHPWILLCKKHNRERVSKGKARLTTAPSGINIVTQDVTMGSTSLPTPPSTNVGSPASEVSPLPTAVPLSPVSMPETSTMEVEQETIEENEVLSELAVSVAPIILTPEQTKTVSDFLSTDAGWEELLCETIARCEAANASI